MNAQSAPTPLLLEVGTGHLLTLPAPATSVFSADPRVARVQPDSDSSTRIFVFGVAAGRTTVSATGEDGIVAEYAVTVRERG